MTLIIKSEYNNGKSIRQHRYRGVENVRRPNMNARSKVCTNKTCDLKGPQPLEHFRINRRYRDGHITWCKSCEKQYHKNRYANNRDQILFISAVYYGLNKDKVNKRHKHWNATNAGYLKDYYRKYWSENVGKRRAKCRKYQASKLNATPRWLSTEQLEEMQKIYDECPIGYEVDHIIPIQGKNVVGLHVPWNLQYLPKSLNRSKNNKY